MIKSAILENALDSILTEWEESKDQNININTKNFNIDVYDVKIIDNKIDISFKITSKN